MGNSLGSLLVAASPTLRVKRLGLGLGVGRQVGIGLGSAGTVQHG